VIVGQSEVVEQVDEDSLIGNERAGDVRVWETLDRHGPVVDAQQLVDVQFLSLGLFLRSLLFSKPSKSELSIVEVDNSIRFTCGVLLNLLDFDIIGILSADSLLECHFVGFKIIHFDIVLFFIFLGDSNASCRIIRDNYRANGVHGSDLGGFEKVTKQFSVVLETRIWLVDDHFSLGVLIFIILILGDRIVGLVFGLVVVEISLLTTGVGFLACC
jgi:hypothetical protein